MKNLQVLDAVETLSQLAQVSDRSHPELLPQPERIKKAFETLSQYLAGLYSSDQMLLKNHDYLASLKAVMVIAEEAYDKLDLVSQIFKTAKTDLGEREFNHLYDFYLKKINYKVEHVAGEVFRHAEEEKKRAMTDTHGIKNLEVIRKDNEYELFYIKDEEGLNHFSKNLLRHTQLLGTFDELFLTFAGEDPFVKLKFIDDRLKQKRALSVREELAPQVDYFLKEAYRFKKQPFIASACHMLNALFLASYPSLVLQNDPSKASFEYFNDLLSFLTLIATKPEFHRIGSSIELISDKGLVASQKFVSFVVSALFFARNDPRYIAEHLYQYIPRPQIESFSPYSFFDRILDFDTHLRKLLSNFPSGPLMKALDFIKDTDKQATFAPLRAQLPENVYSIIHKEKPIGMIVSGSFTVQDSIKLAFIDPIFTIFASHLQNQITLVIDFEDLNHLYAKARVDAVMSLESETMIVSCIPMDGMFYKQLGEYAFYDEAFEFKKVLLDQTDEQEGSVYFKAGIYRDHIEPLFDFIHKHFFEGAKKLFLKERLAFIDILHLFMVVSLIHEHDADNVILVCKDGIDQSNVMALSIHALISFVNHDMLLTKTNLDFYISELYGPAMTIRDRAIFEESVTRMISCMTHIQQKFVKDPNFAETMKDFLPALKNLKLKTESI